MTQIYTCLGIECTAHTFGAAVVTSTKELLSDVRDMYTTTQGGIIPTDAAKHHREVGPQIIKEALEKAQKTWQDIDIIAISNAPGLPLSLAEGLKQAKTLAQQYNKPLIPVNHVCAHIEIGKALTEARDPVYIFVSGANTQIIARIGNTYRICGEALSIGLGNALDKFGRAAGLGFPPGPTIEERAKKGTYVELPYVVKGMDVEFSGIITAAQNLLKKGTPIEDICYSLQETGFAMIAEVTERAMAHTKKQEALIIGGVAANKRLSEMLSTMCEERNAKLYTCPLKYCGDNATMIAWTGLLKYTTTNNVPTKEDIDINPRERIDKVSITWE